MNLSQLMTHPSPAPGRPKVGSISSGDRLRYAASEGQT